MKRAGRIQLNRKRVKSEVMSIRESSDNYNIFVGDNRYKTDPALRFKETQSQYRFAKFMRRRNRNFI